MSLVRSRHLPEVFELLDAGRDSAEGVEQRHDLVPRESGVGMTLGNGQTYIQARRSGNNESRKTHIHPNII